MGIGRTIFQSGSSRDKPFEDRRYLGADLGQAFGDAVPDVGSTSESPSAHRIKAS